MKYIYVVYSLIALVIIIPLFPTILSILGIKNYTIISDSMSHKTYNETLFKDYMESIGLEKIPIRNGFEPGDIVIVKKSEYMAGDVVSHVSNFSKIPKLHRMTELNNTHFTMIGDKFFMNKNRIAIANNKISDLQYVDPDLSVDEIEGKVISVLPRMGMLKVLSLCSQTNRCKIMKCLFQRECRDINNYLRKST